MTKNEAAKRYMEKALELADIILRLEDIRIHLDYTTKSMDDAGDPAYMAEEGLTRLGVSLAAALTYAEDYRKEAEEEKEDE